MPCYVEEPSMSGSEFVKYLLCQACKFLTKEQMKSVRGPDIYQGLFDWYTDHLLHDFVKNYNNNDQAEVNICLAEAERLSIKIYKDEEHGCFVMET